MSTPSGQWYPPQGGQQWQPPNSKAQRPWYKKKRFIIPLALLGLVLISAIFGSGGSDETATTTPAPAPISTPAPASPSPPEVTDNNPTNEADAEPSTEAPLPMPNVVGQNLQAAQDQIQRSTGVVLVLSHDIISGRAQINDSAWKVCDQDPAPGTPITSQDNGKIDLGVVRGEESCSGAAAPAPAVPTVQAPSSPEPGSVSQSNAVEKAKSYLRYSSFSESGLINQLEFEGFSNDEATKAVQGLDVDWNEQAAKKAQSYLDYSSFSRSGLIHQLEFDGFTNAQATYGADSVGI